MDWHIFWQAVKWVLVVLAAGFVGQFGRHMAKLILERRRQRRAQAELEAEAKRAPQATDPELEKAKLKLEEKRLKEQAKLEKKHAKAELKRAKKAGKRKSPTD